MEALLLGLVAALAWGGHDICVRYVSQRTSIYSALLTVLTTGLILQTVGMASLGQFAALPPLALWLSVASGLFFIVASLGLYLAFSVGPVRLVSPIISAYPVLSVGWAAASGNPVSAFQWLAVLVVVAGVSAVAVLSDASEVPGQAANRKITILWSIVAGIGFAATFATGHEAIRIAQDLPVILATRATACIALLALMLALRQPLLPSRHQIPLLVMMGGLDCVALICVLSAGKLPNAEFAAVAASTFGMITIVLAWWFLKEKMTPSQWAGVILVFSGIGYLAV